MVKLPAVGTVIFIDKNERRAGNCIERTPTLGYSLDERCFARAEIALQTDQIAWLKQSPKPHSDAAGLFWTAAEKFKCVFIQYGHAGIIRQRIAYGKRGSRMVLPIAVTIGSCYYVL